ncbi:MAG: phosphoesterase [Acidobacteria bacterium]|nr:phosphoesterase [Acidobacteriota bacterium]
MKMKVLYHGNCFDGVASAAIFSRFYRETVNPDAEFAYGGLMHRADRLFEDDLFDGDENAIVDFKYSSSPRLTWWFDHHQSAFLSPEDEIHFRRDRSGKKFLDPSFKSCTKFIAALANERFGWRCPDMDELVHWADIIDGAQYPNAGAAVEMKEPALHVLLVIEASRDKQLALKLINDFQTKPLSHIATEPYIVEPFQTLYQWHLNSIDVIRREASCRDGVVYFDVSEHEVEGYNKFIPYYLFPEVRYSVGVSLSSSRAKVSVGSNPWSPKPREHNLAKICERYGGGGHAAVAAISFAPDRLEAARAVAQKITAELRGEQIENRESRIEDRK